MGRAWSGFPEQLDPWKCPKPGWTGLEQPGMEGSVPDMAGMSSETLPTQLSELETTALYPELENWECEAEW